MHSNAFYKRAEVLYDDRNSVMPACGLILKIYWFRKLISRHRVVDQSIFHLDTELWTHNRCLLLILKKPPILPQKKKKLIGLLVLLRHKPARRTMTNRQWTVSSTVRLAIIVFLAWQLTIIGKGYDNSSNYSF